MKIRFTTFLQLLAGHKQELGDVRSFLDECLPCPTTTQEEAVKHLLNSGSCLIEATLDDGWIVTDINESNHHK